MKNGWRPMDTAPIEGDILLLAKRTSRYGVDAPHVVHIAQWDWDREFPLGWLPNTWDSEFNEDDVILKEEAVAWQPIPKPEI